MPEKHPSLPPSPTLADYQRYIAEMEQARGLQTDLHHYTLLMGEEVGELFKAIRKRENHQIDPNSKTSSVEEELADVFIFVASIANYYGIDLEQAVREKEEVNKNRTWARGD